MIVLFSTALAAGLDPDAIRVLAETDPHAATLASVGLDVDGLVFLCEADAPYPGTRSRTFADHWRWAIFTSDRSLDELTAAIEDDLGRPRDTAAGRASWQGRGGSVWFAGNDLAYGNARVDLLTVDTPRAHLTCDSRVPRDATTVIGITASRKRPPADDGGSTHRPPRAPTPPRPVAATDRPCTELPVATVVDDIGPFFAVEGDVVVAAGHPASRIDLVSGVVDVIDAPVWTPVARLGDGRWVTSFAPFGVLTFVDPATWQRRKMRLPTTWTQQWSPLANLQVVPVADGIVVRNGFDAPALWREGAWVEAPPLPERLFERQVQVLDDGRLLAWDGDDAEVVHVETGKAERLRVARDAFWISATPLGEGRVLVSALSESGAVLTTYDLETRAPMSSIDLCGVPPTLLRLGSGRVVGTLLQAHDGRTWFYWVEPP